MNVFIVSATLQEVEPLLNELHVSGSHTARFFETDYKDHAIHIHISGIGMISMADCTARFLRDDHDVAFNIGIAGCFAKNIPLGSVVNVVEDRLPELGAEDGSNFLTLEQMKLPGQDYFTNKSVFLNPIINQLPKVDGITVNTVHGNMASIKKIKQRLSPIVESMEGAAFMNSCQFELIPYAQIRSISNYVEPRNRESWNIPLAVNNLCDKMLEILEAFGH